MKRYSPDTITRTHICGSESEVPYMREDATGAYVALADAQALQREIAQLRAIVAFADARINHSRATATAPGAPC